MIMKKYLQYNASQYLKNQSASDTGGTRRRAGPGGQAGVPGTRDNGGVGEALDLSGRPGQQGGVAMVTGQKWKKEMIEQEAALDLSRGTTQHMTNADQSEALDLSKPSPLRASQPAPSPRPSVQSPLARPHSSHSLQSPPPSQAGKPVIGQYSLLQAALNSAPPHSVVSQAGLEKMAQLEAELRARMIAGGMAPADASRAIKPFSSLSSRPLGISVPHLANPSSSIAVVHGVHHKPIAITTPQPQQSLLTAKHHNGTHGSATVNNTNNQSGNRSINSPMPVSQSDCMSGGYSNQSTALKGMMGMHGGYINRGEVKHEQFVMRTPDSTCHMTSSEQYVKVEPVQGYGCSQCAKVFKNKAALKLHSTVHKPSSERQYECGVCGRRFLHRHHLVVHQRRHSGEKPYACQACGATFMAIFLLHKHLRKHVRENSPASAISTAQLQQLHIRKMTSDGPHGTHGIVGNVTNPVIIDEGPVAVVKTEVAPLQIAQDKPTANNLIQDSVALPAIEVRDEESSVITISSDELNSSMSTLSASNSSVLTSLKDISEHAIQNKLGMQTDVKLEEKTVGFQMSNDSFQVFSNVSQSQNTFHQERSQSKPASVGYNTILTDNQHNTETKPEQDNKIASESENLFKEMINPFPDFGSDDEVELDFETGELRLVNNETHNSSDNESMKENTNNAIVENTAKPSELPVAENEEQQSVVAEQTQEEEMGNKEVKNDSDWSEGNRPESDATIEGVVEEKVTLVGNNLSETQNNIEKVTQDESNASKSRGKNKSLLVEVTTSEEREVTQYKCHGDGVEDHKVKTVEQQTSELEVKQEDSQRSELGNKEKIDAMVENNIREVVGMTTVESHTSETKGKEKVFSVESHTDEAMVEKGTQNENFIKMGNKDNFSSAKQIEPETNENNVTDMKDSVEMIQEYDTVRKRKSTASSEDIEHSAAKISSLDVELEDKEAHEAAVKECVESIVNQIQPSKDTKTLKRSKKGRKVKCELCLRTFHSDHHLLLHMVVHKKNPMLISLKKAKANQMKVLGYNGKSSVNCDICKKVFKFQKSLNSHMRVHSEKLKQNKLLSKAFRDFMSEATPAHQKSQQHVDEHESQDNIAHVGTAVGENGQEACDNEITDKPPAHKKVAVDNDPPIKVIIGEDQVKRFLCHACNNTYTTKQKLKMHALIHKDNCFLCDICGKSFFREVTLDKHIATHKLPRPYVCPQCKKSFIHRSSLMRHKVVHEKPALPSLKQQVADVNFELKMLDTYTMLRQERMQQLHTEKVNELKIEADCIETKVSVLDLSVRVKMEDSNLPPVLSPAISQSSIPPQSSSDLSPPLITKETTINKATEQLEQLKTVKSDPGITNIEESPSDTDKVKQYVCEKRRRTISSEGQGIVNSDMKTFQKGTRKTRVYETSCRVCRERFPSVMGLKSHMAVHNTVETHLYECPVCRHRFTQSCSLLRHLKTSCQENRLTCAPCGKTFHRRSTYEQHLRLHQASAPAAHEPPLVPGVMYDARRDEVKEEGERESDIENNNTKSAAAASHGLGLEMPQLAPTSLITATQPYMSGLPGCVDVTKTTLVLATDADRPDPGTLASLPPHSDTPGTLASLPPHSDTTKSSMFNSVPLSKLNPNTSAVTKFVPSELNLTENSSDSTDSDARTYLYSEGEVHIANMSDFSDTDVSPPQSPKPEINRNSLPNNASPNTMTLNLLSAVCSDIRNAEREEEERRKEREERQKELETIEILANLKRGAMQKSTTSLVKCDGRDMSLPVLPAPYPVPSEPHNSIMDLSHVKLMPQNDLNKHTMTNVPQQHGKHCNKIKVEPPNIVNYKPDDNRTMQLPIEKDIIENISSKEPILTIPTVVHDVTAEADRVKKEKLDGVKQNQPIQFQPGKDNLAIIDEKTQTILKELSRMNVYNSIIQDRLSLLMKAQPSSTLSQKSLTSSSSSSSSLSVSGSVAITTSPHIVTSSSPKGLPTSTRAFRGEPENKPQDLTMKKASTPTLGSDLQCRLAVPAVRERSRSEGAPFIPPPLVPVFRCELCGRIMYNNPELCAHMREHNVSPESFRKRPPFVAISDPRLFLDRAKISQPSDDSSTSDKSSSDEIKVVPPAKKVAPPLTLDLSLKPSPSQTKSFLNSNPTSNLASPLTGSDLSDAVSSPTTPSSGAGNLDHLRIELRNKIYARRRSQGLEELTVEFKSPEPSEMTEEEKKKLDYRRECNRQAAQRSRMRKKDLVDSLLEELHKEEIVNSDLRRKMECLSAEKNFLLKVFDTHTCVNDSLNKKHSPTREHDKDMCINNKLHKLNTSEEKHSGAK